ncbi:acyl-CoA Delta-9 desaturase-like isoform X2 [Diabrotica virgifera virgifera]|uniref:Acyl-CoA Delta(11) desaturase-like n=1 Tax=Diabrotica virgifera virgifera TaxID=50390 RepID=A0ABM5KF61_DIAVI|nr:acyl-CoA Delta-9 desaturase-like isoform X2 [Diabrotica virgifera virgifera]
MTSLHNNVAVRQTNNSFASKQKSKEQIKRNGYFEQDLVWTNIIIYVVAHCLALWGYWRMFTGRMTWKIYAYMHIFGYLAAFGITCGVHRLWSHKAYKAKLPLRIFLMLMQTSTLQNNIYIWARDHRLHHKYTDTDADPHNSNRGFFFSHVGWLLMKKHPEVKHKGKTIDMSDVAADPVVKFQKKTIKPAENPTVSILTWGEGWHNYHHTFPWDYKAAELGNYRMNPSTGFLDLMAYLGQAYDLKTASPEMVRKRIARTGDGLYNHGKVPLENGNAKVQETFHEDCVWGWDDKDMNDEDLKNTTIMFKGH